MAIPQKSSLLGFEDLFKKIPILAYRISLDGKILDINKKAISFLGYKDKKELIGKPVNFLYSKESQEKVKKLFQKFKTEGVLRSEELQIVTKLGEIKDVLLDADTFYDKNKSPLFSISLQKDITEQKKIERDLGVEKERFKVVFNSVTVGILAADIKTKKFVLVNKKMQELTGYTEKELLQMNITKIHPKESLPRIISEFKAQSEGKKVLAENLPVLRKDKKIIFCDISSTPQKIGGESVLLGIFINITEKKKAAGLLQEKIKEFEKINKLMTGRELKMIELKNKIKQLEKTLKSKK